MEARLREFYASAPQTRYAVEVLELSHPDMTRAYVLWAEGAPGEVTNEAAEVLAVEPARFEIEPAGSEAHLDQVYEIALETADPEDTFRTEMDRIPLQTRELVRCVYRVYMSDALDELQGSAVLQVEEVAWKAGAARLRAVSPRFNVTRTGELYVPREIPMLRNFL